MMSLFANFLSYITSPIYSLISTPTWFFSAPGKIWGFSVPWRVAVFTGLLLSVLVGVLIFGQTHQWFGDEQIFNITEDFGRTIALVAVLVIAFSVGVGFATHFWLMEVASRFPLIDEAWKTGIAELRANGIDITDVPLFLILGVPDTLGANAMMQASGLTLGVKPNDTGTKPLLWYTAERNGNLGIFLFLTSCCQTSLMSSGRGLISERGGKEAPANQFAGQTIQGGLQSYDFGAMQSMQLVNEDSGYSDSGVVPYNESAMHSMDGDFEPRQKGRPQQAAMRTIDDIPSDTRSKPEQRSDNVQHLGQSQAKLANDQLQHVCRRLLTARQPYCPCNGVVATVPFQMLKADGEKQGKYLGEATHADLTTLTRELGLRAHAIAVVHGLESDDDFRVFIKRMRDFQSSADIERRLGKGISTWVDFNSETIESVTACACDAFQRLIYKFFSSTQSIKKVDNGQLYRFLAKIRGNVVGNLSGWLSNGFAPQDEDQDGRPRDLATLPQFAGCYFVAAQSQSPDSVDEDRLYAHVPGLFEKVFELESEIEWTGEAITRDNAYAYTANVFFLLTLVAIAIAVVGFFGIAGVIDWPLRAKT